MGAGANYFWALVLIAAALVSYLQYISPFSGWLIVAIAIMLFMGSPRNNWGKRQWYYLFVSFFTLLIGIIQICDELGVSIPFVAGTGMWLNVVLGIFAVMLILLGHDATAIRPATQMAS